VYLESKAEQKSGRKQTVGASSAPGVVSVHGSIGAVSAEAAGGGHTSGGEWGSGVGTGGDTLTALPVFGSVKGEREDKLRHRISKDGKLVRQLGGGGGATAAGGS
jgi:hypothetical protein